jgi:hypothetical protein
LYIYRHLDKIGGFFLYDYIFYKLRTHQAIKTSISIINKKLILNPFSKRKSLKKTIRDLLGVKGYFLSHTHKNDNNAQKEGLPSAL